MATATARPAAAAGAPAGGRVRPPARPHTPRPQLRNRHLGLPRRRFDQHRGRRAWKRIHGGSTRGMRLMKCCPSLACPEGRGQERSMQMRHASFRDGGGVCRQPQRLCCICNPDPPGHLMPRAILRRACGVRVAAWTACQDRSSAGLHAHCALPLLPVPLRPDAASRSNDWPGASATV